MLTVGGNDLLGGFGADHGPGIRQFERPLEGFLKTLPIRPVLVGNVYDPTFGDDSRNFVSVDPRLARANLNRINAVFGAAGARYGRAGSRRSR